MRVAEYVFLAVAGLAAMGALILVKLLPRMNWSAARQLSPVEDFIASEVRERWIGIHPPSQNNPLAATPDNFAVGRRTYNQHCAAGHGLDGNDRNRLYAKFYPPVIRFTRDTQQMSYGNLFRRKQRNCAFRYARVWLGPSDQAVAISAPPIQLPPMDHG